MSFNFRLVNRVSVFSCNLNSCSEYSWKYYAIVQTENSNKNMKYKIHKINKINYMYSGKRDSDYISGIFSVNLDFLLCLTQQTFFPYLKS